MTNEKILEEIYWQAYELGLFDELQRLVEETKKTHFNLSLNERVELAVLSLEDLKENIRQAV